MDAEALAWYVESRRRYDVASFLNEAGHPTEALVRALYTMYATAQALLHIEGLSSGSHRGVTTLLSRAFIRSGRLDRRYVAYYTQTLRDRLDADYYGRQFTEADAEQRLSQALSFMESAWRLLEGL